MVTPESLTIRKSVRLWLDFAKKSRINCAMLAAILATYSLVSAVSLPVYLVSVPYYLYRLARSKDTYFVMIRVGGFNNQLV